MSDNGDRPNPWKKQMKQSQGDDAPKASPFKKVEPAEEDAPPPNPWKKKNSFGDGKLPGSPAAAGSPAGSPASPMQHFSSGTKGVPTPKSPLSPSPQQLKDTVGNAFLSTTASPAAGVGKSPINSPAISRHPSATLSTKRPSEPRSPGLLPTLPEGDGGDVLDSTVRSRISNVSATVAASLGASHSQVQQAEMSKTESPISVPAPEPPPPVLSPEARIVELESQLAAKERELKLSRDQVEALQRLQANSNTDAKIRVLNEERSKLASRIKDTEVRLNREITKLKSDNTTKTQQINDLKSQISARNTGVRKSLHSAEAAQAASLAQANDLKHKVTELQKQLTEKISENQSLTNQLAKAQEAIICGASSGYDSEVKLHQARSALHAIMNEVASAAASSPRAGSGSASPRYLQQSSSPTYSPQQLQGLPNQRASSQSGQMQSPTLVGVHYLQQQQSPQRYSSSQHGGVHQYPSSPSLTQ